MKHWYFVAVFSLIGGVFYINAQDLIALKDGNIIEAKIIEIAPSEIKYKRFDHLNGPTIVVPANDVLSIRYEDGRVEIINAVPADVPKITAMDPNKFIFGINANAGGALGYLWPGGPGFGINIELGKGKFNSEINLMFPRDGFGSLVTFNGFWPGRIGGFYLGGGIGFSFFDAGYFIPRSPDDEPARVSADGEVVAYAYEDGGHYEDSIIAYSLPVGLNIGYKFVTKSGLYFRTGVFAAFDFGWFFSGIFPLYIKPDLAIGWTMRGKDKKQEPKEGDANSVSSE